MTDTGEPPPAVPKEEKAHRTLQELVGAGKLILIAALFIFIVWNWPFFSEWLQSVRHAEFPFGLKFDREQVNENIQNLFKAGNNIQREGNPAIAHAALKQAEVLGPAVQGARVLWVDPRPDNNRYERRILEAMGIAVQLAWSTSEALRILEVKDNEPDLVISNMIRENDQIVPLSKCPGLYSDFPDENLRARYNDDIWQFNASQQTAPPAGFAMGELMAERHPELFNDHQRPRIIFYTGSSGGKAWDACARIITNRPDVLLENVVGALASRRPLPENYAITIKP